MPILRSAAAGRIVCLILEGKHDKEITAELDPPAHHPRLFERVFERHDLEDRSQLVLRVLALRARRGEEGGAFS